MADSGASTPRFTAQSATSEDLLKNQTVGLVRLEDFRKRRRDVEDLKTQNGSEPSDGALTPNSDDGTPNAGFKKRKRKIASKGLLSFGNDDEEESGLATKTKSKTGPENQAAPPSSTGTSEESEQTALTIKRKMASNPNSKHPAPIVMTKATLATEATERERLRKEFIQLQEKVRASEVAIPFVFHDGSNTPGGMVKIKKGEQIWLFLERCRKVGAEMGVGGAKGDGTGAKPRTDGKKSWARIGVDDLICVRGGIIIPHHYELYYFIANKVEDPTHPGRLLFAYRGTTDLVQQSVEPEQAGLLRRPKDEKLEGQDDDPSYTKVVDRRWYERNKHIYPASLWREYKVGKDFEDLAKGRRDAKGNSFFFT